MKNKINATRIDSQIKQIVKSQREQERAEDKASLAAGRIERAAVKANLHLIKAIAEIQAQKMAKPVKDVQQALEELASTRPALFLKIVAEYKSSQAL